MKRIILSLGMLLMLAQNGFATTDAEYDKIIAKQTTEADKQVMRCNKAVYNHPYTSDPEICIKASKLFTNDKFNLAISYLNAGGLYYQSEKNYIKAYEYFMKAAKLGNTTAQKNLDVLCREHSWVCK